MARPRKRTPTAQERILEALQLGATYKRAAAAAGISYDTLNDWMRDDLQFRQQVKEAEGVAAVAALRQIQRAAKSGAWQAAAWILERRYPQEYGRTVQEHTGEQKLVVEYVNDWRTWDRESDERGSGDGGDGGEERSEREPEQRASITD